MLKLPTAVRKTNQEVLRTARTKRELRTTIKRRHLTYLRHIFRQKEKTSDILKAYDWTTKHKEKISDILKAYDRTERLPTLTYPRLG